MVELPEAYRLLKDAVKTLAQQVAQKGELFSLLIECKGTRATFESLSFTASCLWNIMQIQIIDM